MKSPFQYFGGKSTVADVVWDAFGAIDNYIEPFFGSGAVLLNRPNWSLGIRWTETVNDADGFLANFWRALQAAPDEVAKYADWPVNESDLEARHLWLVNRRKELTDKLNDPDFYDAKFAGWWVWGMCCWIGGGWCSGSGPWIFDESSRRIVNSRQLPHLGGDGRGINRQLPHLGDDGRGINRKLPHLGDDGRGINRQLPHLGGDGRGINRKLPHLGDDGRGLREYLQLLAARLRWVRVCCGDWSRICGPTPTVKQGITGVFLDPPYSDKAGRDSDIYAIDCEKVAYDVREWCIQWQDDKRMKIILCGYKGEHKLPGWRKMEWKAAGGYENQGKEAATNCKKERIWFSPHCDVKQAELF